MAVIFVPSYGFCFRSVITFVEPNKPLVDVLFLYRILKSKGYLNVNVFSKITKK